MTWVAVARKEALEIVRSPKFAWTFATCAVLVLLSFLVGGRGTLLELERWQAAQAENLRQLEGETDWLEVAPTISVPPQAMAGLVAGTAHDLGRSARIEGRGAILPFGSRYGADPVFAVFRFLDLEFVFRIVLSLFALLFAYDAVCGERERGTLRLCFSHGLSRASFLGGKAVGILGALLVPLLLPIGLGLLLWTAMGVPLGGEDPQRLLGLLLSGVLYLSAFVALAVWVSTLTQRSTHAFLLLLSAWVLLVLVVPRAAVALAARGTTVMSRDEIDTSQTRLASQLMAADQKALHDQLGTLRFGDGGGREAMEERLAKLQQTIDDLAAERERKLKESERGYLEKRQAQQSEQRQLAFSLARLSPAAAFHLAAQSLAGTSLSLEPHIHAEMTRYQEVYGRFQAEKSGGQRGGGGFRVRIEMHDDEEEPAEPQAIDPWELPAFDYRPPSARAGVAEALFDLSLLAAFSLLFFTAAFVTFLRYDLR